MTGWPDRLIGSPPEIAPRLLGGLLRHESAEGAVAVRITEVEAYAGSADPGSHAFRGPTARNAVMFGPPGHLYVYFTYGMHFCSNIVTDADGTPGGVLLRAGEIVEGSELARRRRARPGRTVADRDLARGPALLCSALGIDREQAGSDLTIGPVTFTPGTAPSSTETSTGPRVGLRQAPDTPWRFWLTGDPTVSSYRPAPRRTATARHVKPGRATGRNEAG